MTHIAFSLPTEDIPASWPSDYFADSLTHRRLCLPPVTVRDNREAFQRAFWANQVPYRVSGASYQPFTLEKL